MRTIETLDEYLKTLSCEEKEVFVKHKSLIDFILVAFEGKTRRGGKPYWVHPLEVARITYEISKSDSLFKVALAHDVLEDTTYDENDLLSYLSGEEIRLVRLLTKDSGDHREYYERIHDDWSALTIKVADRIHNLRSSWELGEDKDALRFRKWYYRTTLRDLKPFGVDQRLVNMLYHELDKIEKEGIDGKIK